MKKYLEKSYSWTILTKEVFLKQIDKSTLFHNGTGIPKGIVHYFGIDNIEVGNKVNTKIFFKNKSYNAHFEIISLKRTRLMWSSKFSKKLKLELPKWSKVLKQDTVIKNNKKPVLRFEKSAENYNVELINYKVINQDIKKDISNNYMAKEGKKTYSKTKRYERNPKLRKKAIKYHGLKCNICGFDFEEIYGELGKNYIEVHHKNPLSKIDKEVKKSAKKDLITICSNCHRMIHRFKKVITIDKMKKIINKK